MVGLILLQASSSIGRAAVSKTAGWGFGSLLACQISQVNLAFLHEIPNR